MRTLAENWWAFVLRGIVAIFFGVLALLMPGMALLTLVFLFGFYAITDGALNIVAAFRYDRQPQQQPWWTLVIQGVLGIGAGLIALFLPRITAIVLLYVIAAWLLVTGIMEIVAAIRLRKHIRGEWLMALSGALSIVLGVLFVLFPGAGALAVVLWIGVFAIALGVLLITLGLRLRKHAGGEQATPAVSPGG